MSIGEIEAWVLRLDPQSRTSLAGKVLGSLETLSPEEDARLWAEEARRHDAEPESEPSKGRPAEDVY